MSRIIALCFALFAETASADVMLKFNDGTANVWESYYENGTQYCTKKSFGEYCVLKKDVISIKEVPAGTQATEYSMSTVGIDQDGADSCTVVKYNTYDDVQLSTTPGIVTMLPGNPRIGVTSGGNVVEHKTTYMTVTIKNNTTSMKRVSPGDILVRTIKGNTTSPKGEKTVYIGPGETKTIEVKFSGLSQATNVKCSCY